MKKICVLAFLLLNFQGCWKPKSQPSTSLIEGKENGFSINGLIQKGTLEPSVNGQDQLVLNLSNKNLECLSGFSNIKNLHKVKILNLSGNKLTKLCERAFELMPELTHLDLSSNVLQSFDAACFKGCPKLVYLNLSKNNISEIKFFAHQLTQLKGLYLEHNNISLLDHSGLEYLDRLETLDISFNKCTSNRGIKNMESLKILNLSNNAITKLNSRDFASLRHLVNVDLSHNKLTTLVDLPPLKTVHALNLENNVIANIECDFSNFWRLVSINLKKNQIKNIDSLASLEKLRRLWRVDISDNDIKNIKPLDPLIKKGNCAIITNQGIYYQGKISPLNTPLPALNGDVDDGNDVENAIENGALE